MARRIEDVGFDAIWLGDHLLYRWPGVPEARGPWEVWTMLAGDRGVDEPGHDRATRRLDQLPRPGDARQAGRRRSTRSAAGAWSWDSGAGWNETEYRAFGFPFDHRISRFEEAFTIIRTLLSRRLRSTSTARSTRSATASCCRDSTRPGGPPLLLGSSGERMLRICRALCRRAGMPGTTRPAIDAGRRRSAAGRRSMPRRSWPAAEPADIERSVAVLVQLPGGTGRFQGGYSADRDRAAQRARPR